MQLCATCNIDNPDGTRYCVECSAVLLHLPVRGILIQGSYTIRRPVVIAEVVRVALIVLVLGLLSACSGVPTPETTRSAAPTARPSGTPSAPTAAIATAVAAGEASTVPARPSTTTAIEGTTATTMPPAETGSADPKLSTSTDAPEGTALPRAVAPITTGSAGQLTRVAPWGKGRIYNVVFSPDGRQIAVTSWLGVYLYDAATLAEDRFIPTEEPVVTVTYAPDGQTLVTGGKSDRMVKVWRVADGMLLHTLEGDYGWIYSVAYGPDGQTLATGSLYGAVQVWRVADGTLLRTLEGHIDIVYSVAYAPDGQTLVSGSADKTVKGLSQDKAKNGTRVKK